MLNIDLFPWLERISKDSALAYEKKRRRQMVNYLQSVDPVKLEAVGQQLALRSFQRAAGVKFYKDLLNRQGIPVATIKTPEGFKNLPIIDKSCFSEHQITDLTNDGTLKSVKTVLTSSGFSGVFSFGLNLPINLQNTARLIDFALDFIFDISRQKTLILNCLPMGVKVYTNACVLAEVSVRDDMAIGVIKKFHSCFDQILIIGEAFFLKHLVEQGLKQQVDWRNLNISLIAAEDSFPENYRTYMADILGIDLEAWPIKRLIGSSLGIAELDLNLFHETPDTIRLRRLAHSNADFRKALFGANISYCPMLFQYYPHRTYLEQNEQDQIIVTMLSKYLKIPLVRYNSGDCGGLISYTKLALILKSFRSQQLLPRLRLPLVFVAGRQLSESQQVSAELVREVLFSDVVLAQSITGFFKLKADNHRLLIDIQVKQQCQWQANFSLRISKELAQYFSGEILINPVDYFNFKEALTLDYNKKFKHY